MEYKLMENSLNDIDNPIKTIFLNRGFNENEIYQYLNLNDDVLLNYNLLDNIQLAIDKLLYHIENNNNIHIVIDSDFDGFSSASILYMGIKLIKKDINITYSIHEGKEHGLSEDIIIPTNTNLIILPDAGTNDVNECKLYYNNGIDIIILDHHEKEVDNPYAIIVNNKMSENYINKELCGCGIVYKFLKSLDEELWNNNADNFIDLVAFANIADNMDLKNLETRHLVNKGLQKIKNKMLLGLIDKQSFSMKGEININSVQFYINPLVNAMVRFGTQEQKELMFKGFIEEYSEFNYKSSKNKDERMETIYEKVARECTNARAKQNREKEKSTKLIIDIIKNKELDKNKVIMLNVNDMLKNVLTGLVAMDISEIYKRPCLLYRFNKNKKILSGSARNYNDFPIKNLKDLLLDTKLFEFCAGHQGAFGYGFKKEKKDEIIFKLNEMFKDIDINDYFYVDFKINIKNLNSEIFNELNLYKDIWCNGISEPLIAIENINLNMSDLQLIGSNSNTIKFNINDIEFVKFKLKEDDEIMKLLDSWESDITELKLNIIGRTTINEFYNERKPQFVISGYKIIYSK